MTVTTTYLNTAFGHTGNNTVITVPTCTEEGYTTYICSVCGCYVGEYISATDHSLDQNGVCIACGVAGDIVIDLWDSNHDSWSGCALEIYEDGELIGTATIDHGSSKQVTIQVTIDYYPGREYTFQWVTGSYASECSFEICLNDEILFSATSSDCEGFTIGQVVYTLESACIHSYEAATTAPTCTEEGYTTYTCTLCGHFYKDDTVPATGHSYDAVITAPTCTEEGYTTYTCTLCGHSYQGDTVSVIDHSYEAAVTAPTCLEEGYTTYTCTVCGDSYVDDAVSATGHSFDDWKQDKIPTCDQKGSISRKCVYCEEREYIEVAALGHSYSDGYCTACGAKDPDYVEILKPEITMSYPSLSFEDEIFYNVYYTVDDASNIVEMGLITFGSKLTDGTMADAVDVIPGYINSGNTYMVHTNGIPAKNLGDALYFKIYAKLSDGSYVYSDVAGYHAVAYANTVLNNASSSAKAKALVVAMLNYGAAAQEHFGYKTDALMNASLTAEQQALVKAYDSSMVQDVVKADASKTGIFKMNGGYSNAYPTVSFEGAFSINYYFTPNKSVDDGLTFYYWDAETYNSVSKLTAQNATGRITMVSDGKGNWGAAVEGIAAKDMDSTIYVAGIYTSNGTSYPTNVIAYSLGNYCKTVAANGEAFGAATAVYGYYAKAYFA